MARPRIAIVEDDAELRAQLRSNLETDGFDVRTATDEGSGVALVRAWRPDAIVLDVVRSDGEGFATVPILRSFTQVPILLLSVRGDVQEKVAGLEAGADDYLVKPVSIAELAARLKSALRRPQLDRSEIVRFADLELDLTLRSALRGGKRIALSTREYELLETLIRRPRRVFTRDELLSLVWGADRDITPNTVETYISYLRAKLDRPPFPRLIRTVRGVGYTLSLDD